MSPLLPPLLAALAAAAPQPEGKLVAAATPAQAALAADQLNELMLQALPPPPNVVVRTTRYYGTVVVDHRAHLARRASCKSCHGPVAVTKLEFTPKLAHQRCIGCHQELAKGPTRCQGCHVKSIAPPAQLASAALTRPPPPPPPEPNPKNVAAALAAYDAERSNLAAAGREPFHRAFEVGFVVGSGSGVSVRLAEHQDLVLLTQSFERLASHDFARTVGLFGGGVSRPIAPGMSVEAVALGGFDVVDRPLVALLPALGARGGFEWRTKLKVLQQVNASLTCVADLTRKRAGDREAGGVLVYGAVGAGFALPPR